MKILVAGGMNEEASDVEALGKDIIVVATEGTNLPFDTKDVPTHTFPNYTALEKDLRLRIEKLSGRQAAEAQSG